MPRDLVLLDPIPPDDDSNVMCGFLLLISWKFKNPRHIFCLRFLFFSSFQEQVDEWLLLPVCYFHPNFFPSIFLEKKTELMEENGGD